MSERELRDLVADCDLPWPVAGGEREREMVAVECTDCHHRATVPLYEGSPLSCGECGGLNVPLDALLDEERQRTADAEAERDAARDDPRVAMGYLDGAIALQQELEAWLGEVLAASRRLIPCDADGQFTGEDGDPLPAGEYVTVGMRVAAWRRLQTLLASPSAVAALAKRERLEQLLAEAGPIMWMEGEERATARDAWRRERAALARLEGGK